MSTQKHTDGSNMETVSRDVDGPLEMLQSGEADPLEDNIDHAPEDVWYWHPLTLSFHDDHHEHLYSTLVNEAHARSERFVHLLGMVPGVILTILYWETISWQAATMELGWSFVFAPMFVYLSSARPLVYRKWRMPIVLFIRCGHIVTMTSMVRAEGMPKPFVGSVVSKLLAKSPVANMVFCAFNLSLPFRYHVVVSIVQFGISLMWVVEFCSMCYAAPLLTSLFNKIAQSIDNFTILSLLFGSSASEMQSSVSCEVVSVFVLATVGYIIPAAGVYCLEIISRTKFLLERVPEGYAESVARYKNDGFRLAIWIVTGVIQFLWLCLTFFFL